MLEWSQKISHCKSMQIFWHSRAVNSTVWGWFYLKFKLIQVFMVVLEEWPRWMKKIQSKMKKLEWLQQKIHQLLRCSRGAYFIIGYETLMKFKPIQSFIVVLIICKNKEDPFKIESTRVSHHFSHDKSMGILQMLKGSWLHSPRSYLAQMNPFGILWLSSLSARMKKIQSKMRALECSQQIIYDFSDAQG